MILADRWGACAVVNQATSRKIRSPPLILSVLAGSGLTSPPPSGKPPCAFTAHGPWPTPNTSLQPCAPTQSCPPPYLCPLLVLLERLMLLSFASLPSSASWHASFIEQQKYIINLQPSQLVQVQFLAAFPTSRYTTSSVPSSHPTVLPYQVDPALARTCVVAFDIFLGFPVFVISVLLLHMFRRLFSLVGYRMIYYIDIWFFWPITEIFANASLYYARASQTCSACWHV